MWKKLFAMQLKNNVPLDKISKYKNNYLPSKLFKYRSIEEYTIEAFKNDYAYFSNPKRFNDPYDCLININYKDNYNLQVEKIEPQKNILKKLMLEASNDDAENYKIIEDILKQIPEKTENDLELKSMFFNYIKNNDFDNDELGIEYSNLNITATSVEGYIDEIINTMLNDKDRIQKHVVNSFGNEILDNILKVYCLSEKNNSILMWSHYANNHEGFCIGYDMKELGLKVQELTMPVIYSNKLVKEINVDNICNNDFLYSLLSKCEEWEYEQEWRIIDINNFLLNKMDNYLKMKPSELYLGAKINSKDKATLKEIAEKKQLDVYQMVMSKDEYVLKAVKL
ncbi:DUF2971 domain-containing protein [Clostridium paraputrificum]|uniref:DUF2971 domain-containing protein n=1 Tax=Clostridium paraputrificum TaxID=29363 RepID=UPI001B3C8190|nr:DUF2971 domain-containing protein [Clostridium paraputrificum]